MSNSFHNLTESLSVLGKSSRLSLTQRQKIRDQLFKKIGQVTLVDAVATNTEVDGLIMPVEKIRNIFQPRKMSLGLPAMMSVILVTVIGTATTATMAKDATAGDGVLFTLRKGLEATQIALTPNPTTKAEVKLSIANDRIKDVIAAGSVAGPHLDKVLTESKKAVATAATAVVDLKAKTSDEATTDELTERLNEVIISQSKILDEIVAQNTDEKLKENALAMVTELKTDYADILPEESKEKSADPVSAVEPTITATATETTDNTGFVQLTGILTNLAGRPALTVGAATYLLSFAAAVDLMPYMGANDIRIEGQLKDGVITVYRLIINNSLIGEWQPATATDANKNNNQPSGVENVPN